MPREKFNFMVLDCETATLPFANEIANGDAEKKKKICIARPLIYDIGWTICDRAGTIIEAKQFLIAEIFSVPAIFNTAYYADKRPKYLEMLERKEISVKSWNDVMKIFMEDAEKATSIGAFNSMFDFKKALPFTELYINKLYSPHYMEWEEIQRRLCYHIANDPYKKDPEKEFDAENFTFRGKKFPLFDLWGLSVAHLLNCPTYKKQCLAHNLLTASGTYFKTSAESTFQYLCNKYDFVESHTALEDALIETYILSRIAKRHAISTGIAFFPFRQLGDTIDFVMRRKVCDIDECAIVFNAITQYIDAQLELEKESNYLTGLMNKISYLSQYMGIESPY